MLHLYTKRSEYCILSLIVWRTEKINTNCLKETKEDLAKLNISAKGVSDRKEYKEKSDNRTSNKHKKRKGQEILEREEELTHTTMRGFWWGKKEEKEQNKRPW